MEAVKRYIEKTVIIILIASMAFLYFYPVQQEADENISVGVNAGYQAMDLSLTGIDGKTMKLSDHRGELLVVDFMAPWCSPCKEQIKVLRELYDTPGVNIISINVDPEYNTTYLKKFKDQEGMSWPLASSAEAAQNYKVTGIPLIIFVDKAGVIRYRGYYTALNQFEQLVNSYR
jgi:peroxiredoxin